ncbi:hypothetical protein ACFL26_02455 [Patescibacteria group bacterium]
MMNTFAKSNGLLLTGLTESWRDAWSRLLHTVSRLEALGVTFSVLVDGEWSPVTTFDAPFEGFDRSPVSIRLPEQLQFVEGEQVQLGSGCEAGGQMFRLHDALSRELASALKDDRGRLGAFELRE